MSAKHTRGPWKVPGPCKPDEAYDITACDGDWVASAYADNDDERRGNAYLIAAAPEMLSALKTIVDTLDALLDSADKFPAYRYAAEAIAKAEGKAV